MRLQDLMINVLAFVLVLVTVEASWAEGSPQYKVVMSKNDRVCGHVREVLNKGLQQYGVEYHTGKFMNAIFSAISWKPIGMEEGFDYGGDMARFDINNDGQVDVVVRLETSGGKDINFMKLFVFDDAGFSRVGKSNRNLEEKSVGSVDASFVYIYPFIFDQTTYLLLMPSPDRMEPTKFWVEQYKGGKVGYGSHDRLGNVCFIQ